MKKTFIDYITVLFGNGFARGMALLNSLIIARLLGPADFGRFSIFYIVMILTWQIPQSFDTTFIRYARTSDSDTTKNNYLKASIFLKIFYSGILLCLTYPLSIFLARYLFNKPEIHIILMSSMISGVCLSFLMTLSSIYQERERFAEFSILNAFYTVSIFFILLFFKSTGRMLTLEGTILIFLIVSIIVGILSAVLLFKKIEKPFVMDAHVLKKSFSLGKWIFGSTLLYFTFQRMDIIFLTRYANFESVGIYSVAAQLVMSISLLTGSLSGIFLPKSGSALDSESSFKIYKKESILAITLIGIFIIIVMLAAPFMVQLLYGDKYIPAISILRILLMGWIFIAAYIPFSFLFYTLNDSKTPFLIEFFKMVIGISLLYYLVFSKGILGAAIAVSTALILSSIMSLIILKRKIKERSLSFKLGYYES